MKADCCENQRIYFRTALTLNHPPFKNTTAAYIHDKDQVQSIMVVNLIRLGEHEVVVFHLDLK